MYGHHKKSQVFGTISKAAKLVLLLTKIEALHKEHHFVSQNFIQVVPYLGA